MRMRALAGFTFILMASAAAGVAADEWRVEKLDGLVFVHHEAQWHRLELGDIVSDERVIRTLASGSVEFVRDEEHIALDGNSQIQIKDAARSRFTTVEQWYGKVTIQAEKQNVQHFSVETPYLAAVVKGTQFTVISGDGEARVIVDEGTVEVHDELYEVVTDVHAGQRADVAPGTLLEVSGPGPKAPVISIGTGEIVTEAVREAVEDGDVLPGEVGKAISNIAAGDDPGKGLGQDNANGNAHSGGNGSGNQGNGNSGNGNSGKGGGNGIGVSVGNGGVGVSVGIGNGKGNANDNGNSGHGGGGGIGVSLGVGSGNGSSGSGGGIDVGLNIGGGGIGLNIGGGNNKGSGSGSSGSGHGGGGHGGDDDDDDDDDRRLLNVNLGGLLGGLL